MTVLLTRSYGAYAAGQIVELPASTEAALIAQNLAQASAAVVTSGPISSNELQGAAAIPAGSLSVVITNPNVNASSKVVAYIAQTAADATLTTILRVVPAAGSFTVFGNANATAATLIEWYLPSSGLSPSS